MENSVSPETVDRLSVWFSDQNSSILLHPSSLNEEGTKWSFGPLELEYPSQAWDPEVCSEKVLRKAISLEKIFKKRSNQYSELQQEFNEAFRIDIDSDEIANE